MKTQEILLAGGIIDFCINKNKYNSYKTKSGKKNFIYKCLDKNFKSIIGQNIKGVQIRDVSITSNEFWGNDTCFINDIGYNHVNILPLNENYLTVRYFGVNLVGVTNNDIYNCFIQIKNNDFLLTVSNVKLV